jgi:hypothetical protein
MSSEALLAAGYAALLMTGAFVLEWLSAHTHRRSLRYRTAGFTYDDTHDHWECPAGEHLWPHEFDHERRLVRYRAQAHVCNACPRKDACTDSDRGREIVRPLDPWPHSEAGRFHRGISLVVAVIAGLILAAEILRNHAPPELAVLGAALAVVALTLWHLHAAFRITPANFPDFQATPSSPNSEENPLTGYRKSKKVRR